MTLAKSSASAKLITNWDEILPTITTGMPEANLEIHFVQPLLKELGLLTYFDKDKVITGLFKGHATTVKPDYICWSNSDKKSAPILVVEDKSVNPTLMANAIDEIQQQMIISSATFGLATNGLQLQLFQRHGDICVPRTRLEDVSVENIERIIAELKSHLNKPRRALTVMFWNNKGGVGKTTVTANIGAALAKKKNLKVLIINFDLQGDLNTLLGLESLSTYEPSISLYEALDDVTTGTRKLNLNLLVKTKDFNVKTGLLGSTDTYTIDIIPGDKSIRKIERGDFLEDSALKQLLSTGFFDRYDYILIDASPSWRGIGNLAAYAADLVIPVVDNSNFAVDAVERLKNDYLIPEEFEDDSAMPPQIFGYIINSRYQNKSTVESAIDRLTTRLKDIGLNQSSWLIPNYAEIERSTEKGQPVVFSRPNGNAAKTFIAITESIFL